MGLETDTQEMGSSGSYALSLSLYLCKMGSVRPSNEKTILRSKLDADGCKTPGRELRCAEGSKQEAPPSPVTLPPGPLTLLHLANPGTGGSVFTAFS